MDDGKDLAADDVVVLDDDGEIFQKTTRSGNRRPIDSKRDFENQKKTIAEEIQRETREANMKREAILRLIGLMKTLDPIYEESKEKAEIVRKKLLPKKKAIKEDVHLRQMYMAIGMEGNTFFEAGSKVELNNQAEALRALKNKNLNFSRDIAHRSQAYATFTARHRDSIRKTVIADKELFKKTRIGKNDKLQQDFSKMNQGILKDKLNTSDYATKKNAQFDYLDQSIKLDDNVLDIIEDDAPEKFDQMVRDLWDKKNAPPPVQVLASPAPAAPAPIKKPPSVREDSIVIADNIDASKDDLLSMDFDSDKEQPPKPKTPIPEPKEEPKTPPKEVPPPPPPKEENPPPPPVKEDIPPPPPILQPTIPPPPPILQPTIPPPPPLATTPLPPPPILPPPPKEEKPEPPVEIPPPPAPPKEEPAPPKVEPAPPKEEPKAPPPPSKVSLEDLFHSPDAFAFQENLTKFKKGE